MKSDVIDISAASSTSEVTAAIAAGAAGFISKMADPDEIPPLLELAVSGELAVDKRTAPRLITASHRRTASVESVGLSDRELEVLELAARGCTNHQIAQRLHLSRTSVSDALTRAYRKLNATDRASATRIAVQLGMVFSPAPPPG